MVLRSLIEIIHRDKVLQSDELPKSINQAFYEISISVSVHANTYEYWKLVLDLICSGRETNEMVEEHCNVCSSDYQKVFKL